ncbi:MAG: hypothetical protein R3E12_18690 [Candidatus Eisenbacteria bacterium]
MRTASLLDVVYRLRLPRSGSAYGGSCAPPLDATSAFTIPGCDAASDRCAIALDNVIDEFSGSAPDLGAYELDSRIPAYDLEADGTTDAPEPVLVRRAGFVASCRIH